MKRLLITLFVVLVALLASCTHPSNPLPGSALCSVHRSALDFWADASFTPTEREAIDGAPAEWRALSRGRISSDIRYGTPPLFGARIHRVTSADPIVQDEEAKQAKARGVAAFPVFGWSEVGPPREIFLVVDRVATPALRHLLGHELGHAAGLYWPGCVESGRQLCWHSPDPGALMSAGFQDQALGASDLAFCRASCLCD